jgi:effector-binding domain-containing protein
VTEVITMHTVRIKERPSAHVATKRQHTTFEHISQTFHHSMDDIVAWIAAQGVSPAGKPFAIYHNIPFDPSDVDMELGVPVEPLPRPRVRNGVDIHDLPASRVATATHAGPYTSIGSAYDDLYAWLGEHELEPAGPPREIYLVGPGDTSSPDEYLTEIEIPLR